MVHLYCPKLQESRLNLTLSLISIISSLLISMFFLQHENGQLELAVWWFAASPPHTLLLLLVNVKHPRKLRSRDETEPEVETRDNHF